MSRDEWAAEVTRLLGELHDEPTSVRMSDIRVKGRPIGPARLAISDHDETDAEHWLRYASDVSTCPILPGDTKISCLASCKICEAHCIDGEINHGKGCYHISTDGGGTESCRDCS